MADDSSDPNLLRSDDTDASWERLTFTSRWWQAHTLAWRREVAFRMLRSIRATRATTSLAASVDPSDARWWTTNSSAPHRAPLLREWRGVTCAHAASLHIIASSPCQSLKSPDKFLW